LQPWWLVLRLRRHLWGAARDDLPAAAAAALKAHGGQMTPEALAAAAEAAGIGRKGGAYFKTRVCKYWQEGKCPKKGEVCSYAHHDWELRGGKGGGSSR